MVEPLPKWIMKRYAKLWKSFSSKDFNFEKSVQVLKEDNRIIAIILSNLKKTGWISTRKDPTHPRKRIYNLKNPEDAVRNMKTV